MNFWDGFGWYWGGTGGGRNWKRIFEKTRVGICRTELSLRLSCTEFCARSSGHGPRGLCLYGGSSGADLCFFLGGTGGGSTVTKIEKYFDDN